MSTIAIQAEKLGKMYRLTDHRDVGTLRDLLADTMRRPFRREKRPPHTKPFWALRDVSFALKQGEVLGIIGRNGSGKSTLLKLLARISRPSEGWLEVRGRIRSLLEVGVGFHPELSGRENIYLNGSIMGIKRSEIDRHLDEIIDFSGVAPFIDMPVKFYSSGMYVRLAFSASAHLDPDILLIDEVLAVGDIEFQKKCLLKLDEARQQGRTILLVSHNMAPIADMCSEVIWLEQGRIAKQGIPSEVVSSYMQEQTSGDLGNIGSDAADGATDDTSETSEGRTPAQENRIPAGEVRYDPPRGSDKVRVTRIAVTTADEVVASRVQYEKPFRILVDFQVDAPIPRLRVGIRLHNERHQPVVHTSTSDCTDQADIGTPGHRRVSVGLPERWFTPGRYEVEVGLWSPEAGHHFYVMGALAFQVGGAPFDSIGQEVLRPMLPWQVEQPV